MEQPQIWRTQLQVIHGFFSGLRELVPQLNAAFFFFNFQIYKLGKGLCLEWYSLTYCFLRGNGKQDILMV